jgi:hypothetical protein
MPHVSFEMEIDVVICDFALIDFRKLLASDLSTSLQTVAAVNKLAPDLNLTARDMSTYAEGIKVNEVLGLFAAEYWN